MTCSVLMLAFSSQCSFVFCNLSMRTLYPHIYGPVVNLKDPPVQYRTLTAYLYC